MMRGRRSRDRIIQEILSICAEGENVTRIVYQVNTNFTIIKSYMKALIKSGLIETLPGTPGELPRPKGARLPTSSPKLVQVRCCIEVLVLWAQRAVPSLQ